MTAELIILSEELHADGIVINADTTGFGFFVGGLKLIKKVLWDDA